MICPICGQEALAPGTTTFTTDAAGTVVVIRDVPAQVCANCNEAFISDNVAEEIERQVTDAKTSGTQSLIRRYQPLAS